MAFGTASLAAAMTSADVAAGASTYAAAAAADATASFGTASVLPSLATAATVGSSLISGVGALEQSRASAASAGYNAKVAAQNAKLATQNAAFAGSQGEQEAGTSEAATRAKVGATLANEGASGVDVNTGSSVNVRESEAKLGMLDALTIRSNAAKAAYGYQTQNASEVAQANLLRSQQQSAQTGGYFSAGSDILGGVGSAAKYTTWLNQGGF
jgi:hypothetical protein